MKVDTRTAVLCALLLVVILCLGWTLSPTVTEGMTDAETEQKQLETIKKQWLDAVLPTVLEQSEQNLHKLRFLIPAGDPGVSSGIKKYWALHKKMVELEIVTCMFGFTTKAKPGVSGRSYPLTDAMRKDMEDAVLMGNTIKALDAAMVGLGAGPSIAPDVGAGTGKDEGDWF